MVSMRHLGWVFVAGLGGSPGCTGTCVDDGAVFKQSNEACMAASVSASATEGTATEGTATESATLTASMSEGVTEGSASQSSVTEGGMSASMSDSDSETASDSDSDSVTGGGSGVWCEDKDGDGFGDPMLCIPSQPGEEPPDGFVPNDDDCADDDPFTFPGAAPNDSETECMTDVDGDDWGEPNPGDPDVEPGTDCDDADATTFPGAAEIEDPTACMKDEDDDGWGDTSVGSGVDVGSDCYDSNPNLNPGDQVLYTAFDNGEFATVDPASGQVSVFASVDIAPLDGPYAVITCAISPTDGRIYCSQSAKRLLLVVDYCSGDTPVELAVHNRTVCGLGFRDDGTLYGIDSGADELVIFDPQSGDVIDSKPLTEDGNGINIQTCGMAVDCVSSRMLLTDGQNSRVLSVDPETGEATQVADIPEGQWGSVGLEFDPISKQVYTNNGDEWYQVELDGSDQYVTLPQLSTGINDLSFGPSCG